MILLSKIFGDGEVAWDYSKRKSWKKHMTENIWNLLFVQAFVPEKKITVQSSFIIPQDALNPKTKNFPTNQIIQIVNNNDNIFFSFWNSFWYVSFIFSVLFLINIQMCSLYQAYYWMPDFSPFFLLSVLIEFYALLPCWSDRRRT